MLSRRSFYTNVALYTQKNVAENLNVSSIDGHTIRNCSATVSSRNKVFIIYEYLSETREERIVVVSFSPLHDTLMTFFRKFPAKEFNPNVVIQWLCTRLTYKCNMIQLCIRNMGYYRLCLSYFYITLQ